MENEKFLLRCKVRNKYKGCWEHRDLYFYSKGAMLNYIQNGTDYVKPEDIKVGCIFELNEINVEM